jgi:hypothetical protein
MQETSHRNHETNSSAALRPRTTPASACRACTTTVRRLLLPCTGRKEPSCCFAVRAPAGEKAVNALIVAVSGLAPSQRQHEMPMALYKHVDQDLSGLVIILRSPRTLGRSLHRPIVSQSLVVASSGKHVPRDHMPRACLGALIPPIMTVIHLTRLS